MAITVVQVERPSDDAITGRRAMSLGEIWLVPEAVAHLETLVKPTFSVFEWGAGGSTIWFARHCQSVITIECHPRWYIWTQERLNKEGLSNKVKLWYAHCDKDSLDLYSDTIEAYSGMYDVVSPDGFYPARGECMKLGIRHLKSGGILVIDNSQINMHYDLVQGWDAFVYRTESFPFLGAPMMWESIIYIKP